MISLAAGKDAVRREAFRVLKPGGRFAAADVVVSGAIPEAVRRSLELWSGCIAGALEEDACRAKLEDTGFAEIDIEPTRICRAEAARTFLEEVGLDVDLWAGQIDGTFRSAFIRARKPSAVSA